MPGEARRKSRAPQGSVWGTRSESGALGHGGCLSTQLLWFNCSHLWSNFSQTEAQNKTNSFQFRVACLDFAFSVQHTLIPWNKPFPNSEYVPKALLNWWKLFVDKAQWWEQTLFLTVLSMSSLVSCFSMCLLRCLLPCGLQSHESLWGITVGQHIQFNLTGRAFSSCFPPIYRNFATPNMDSFCQSRLKVASRFAGLWQMDKTHTV